jgi:hypothetical protein
VGLTPALDFDSSAESYYLDEFGKGVASDPPMVLSCSSIIGYDLLAS